MKRAAGDKAVDRRGRAPQGTRPSLVATLPGRRLEEITVDPFRAVVFPNRVREQRARAGYPKLMALATALPTIPYIRLSKIERGEVVARADELVRVADVLRIAPASLLLDVDAPDFDMASWAEPFIADTDADGDEERFTVLLAAALRLRRHGDRTLTLAALDKDFGLPPVVVSRLENAQKPLARWNATTRDAICRVLGMADETALRRFVMDCFRAGDLDAYLGDVVDPDARLARTRERIAAVAAELAGGPSAGARSKAAPTAAAAAQDRTAAAPSRDARRMLPVLGAPLAGGLIAATPTPAEIEAPMAAGERAFGLRVCRATLGGGLPGHATVVVDPDRYPTPGGLAVVREGGGYRLLAITQDRSGVVQGYSIAPAIEITIDGLDPTDVAAVIAASFV